ncbi:hypothetical protein B0T14DRAFT_589576 [Immersiella caudata]|uniref:Uncharacterized protein n=1 Tax=Immersiella caudata TaxID=314043 RepID=A0AA39WKK1_9PEZI|nr:hypothetical protein B0T14DRAFT_589576 [Immersiella caudata]
MSSLPRSRSKSSHSRHRSRSPRGEYRRSEKERYRERERDTYEGERNTREREKTREKDRNCEPDRERKHRHHRRRDSREDERHHHRHHRSRSRDRHHRHSKYDGDVKGDGEPTSLPYYARKLTKSDLATFRPLFAHYLDLQKGLGIEDLDDVEVRGRWKSFLGKWNRGELAEGWYEPETFERVMITAEGGKGGKGGGKGVSGGREREEGVDGGRRERRESSNRDGKQEEEGEEEGEEGEEYGPALPGAVSSIAKPRGPGVPSLQDLELRREMNAEEKDARIGELRDARKADRRVQKERLDELVPRADAGTRERKLEKKKEVNEKMKAFREPSPGGEVPEEELIGGGEGGIADYKRMLAEEKHKVSERQQRREEMERARNAERDERIRAYKDKEEATREMLRQLAKKQFG